MRMVDIIINKRENKEHTEDEIRFLINGYINEEIPEYQISSWLMASFLNGLTPKETAWLTDAMIHSGDLIDLSSLAGPFIDKHSTGGVGDKVSLLLAPIVAACGIKVPMMSGRALGHTGGTLDKLDAIPGYSTALSVSDFKKIITNDGFSMTGQSKKIVPADRLMYSLRDVTGTVESIPLITASIMSKKFAEGAEGLVFDVKCGSGAFMKTEKDATKLAESLVNTGKSLGRDVVAVLTRMEEPLGLKVGNFLEVEESIDGLSGNGPADLMEVTHRLAAWMIKLGGRAESVEDGLEMSKKAVSSGTALKLFYRNCTSQGADIEKLKKMHNQARSNHFVDLIANEDGFISNIDAYSTGIAALNVGVGRNKTDDEVLPLVGVEFFKKCSSKVTKGDSIARIWSEDQKKGESALELLKSAVEIDKTKPEIKPLIIKEIKA